jgi:hypothetical protein
LKPEATGWQRQLEMMILHRFGLLLPLAGYSGGQIS